MATVNSLIYLGNSKADIFFEENSTKCGRHKTLSAKEELFKKYINLASITNTPAQCLSAFKIYIQIPDLQLTVMRYLLKYLLQNDPSQQRFSKYKHNNTAKPLIGISPNGAVSFVSELYAGRKKIVVFSYY